MRLDEKCELPPFEANAAFTGGLQGTLNAEVTLGPAPPSRPSLYERSRPWLMRLRWFIEPILSGATQAFTVCRSPREKYDT